MTLSGRCVTLPPNSVLVTTYHAQYIFTGTLRLCVCEVDAVNRSQDALAIDVIVRFHVFV